MNKRSRLSLFLAFATSSLLFGQGSLTPPGAPAPTMLSLDQLGTKMDQANTALAAINPQPEKRIPISTAPVTISAPGSYYLVDNLSVSTGNAITIAASGVTLDLNGFRITSSAASATGTAILLSGGVRNITIMNGSIVSGVVNSGGTYSGSGFDQGIFYTGGSPATVLVTRISVSGVLHNGINLSITHVGNLVEFCTVHTAGLTGIMAGSVKHSVATDCAGNGIFANEVSDSEGISTASGTGVTGEILVSNCYGRSETGYGVNGDEVINSRGRTTSGFTGLSAVVALNCYGTTSGASYGVYAQVASNCLGQAGTGGHGIVFNQLAAMCYGTAGAAAASVLGGGVTGPGSLP